MTPAALRFLGGRKLLRFSRFSLICCVLLTLLLESIIWPTISAPTITAINVEVRCDTSALITFSASTRAHAFIDYGLTTDYGSQTIDDPVRFFNQHAVVITGLTANTTYNYRITATDVSGSTSTSNQSFLTATSGTLCPALPQEMDTRMPDMTGAVERTVKASGGNFTPAQFQNALDEARDATGPRIITVDAGLTLTGSWSFGNKIDNNWIVVRSSAHASLAAGKRVSPDSADDLFKLTNTNVEAPFVTAAAAHHWRIIGAEMTIEPSVLANAPSGFSQSGIVRLGTAAETAESQWPHHFIFDRCYIHGQPNKNTTRGIYANGTDWAVIDSYISEFHNTGADSQAILMGQGRRGKMVNNYLEAGGENFLIGGVDHTVSPVTTPADITFTHNSVAWKQSWKADDPTAEGYAFTANTSTETLTSTSHGFQDEWTTLRLRSTGTLPAPLAPMTTYAIRSPTTNTTQLGTVLTFTADTATDTFTANSHGLVNNQTTRLDSSNALPAGVSLGVTYFARNVTTNTFQLATTSGGSPIDITTTGSGVHTVVGGTVDITTTGSGSHFLLINWVTKNQFELKLGKRLLVAFCVFNRWWPSEQTGGSIALKNSDNDKDAAVIIQDIVWFRNLHKNAGTGIALNGSNWPDEESTDHMRRLHISQNLIVLDGVTWNNETTGGAGPATAFFIATSVQSMGGGVFQEHYPDELSIVKNTIVNATGDPRQILNFANAPPLSTGKMDNFIFRDNVVGYGSFGIKAGGLAEGTVSYDAIVTTATRVWSDNLIAGSATDYPNTSTNSYVNDFAGVKFVNLAGGNYRLAADSPGANDASDGVDVGANIDAVDQGTALTESGDWTDSSSPTPGGGSKTRGKVTRRGKGSIR